VQRPPHRRPPESPASTRPCVSRARATREQPPVTRIEKRKITREKTAAGDPPEKRSSRPEKRRRNGHRRCPLRCQ
jgi:hypothetical protein